jgi:hypothetical protein
MQQANSLSHAFIPEAIDACSCQGTESCRPVLKLAMQNNHPENAQARNADQPV